MEPAFTTPSPTHAGDVAQVALGTLVTASAAGVSYGFLVAYVPYASLVAPALVVACGAAIAWVSAQLLTARRVRHRGLAVGIPLVAGTLGYYLSWVAWVATLYDHQPAMRLLWNPPSLLATLITLGDAGTWWRPGRYESWVAWVSEAVLFYLGLHITADAAATRLARPYCTRCRAWIGAPVPVGDLDLGWKPPEEFTATLLRRDWEDLADLAASDDPTNCHRLSIARCTCGAVQCLTVDRRTSEPALPNQELRLLDSLVLASDEPARIVAMMAHARSLHDRRSGAPEPAARDPRS